MPIDQTPPPGGSGSRQHRPLVCAQSRDPHAGAVGERMSGEAVCAARDTDQISGGDQAVDRGAVEPEGPEVGSGEYAVMAQGEGKKPRR